MKNEILLKTFQGQYPEKSLLRQFTFGKFSNYKAPTKKRVAKGEKIGFSEKKYALLLLLMGGFWTWKEGEENLERVYAKMLEISYAHLRVWNSQGDFKIAFREHYSEFINIAMDQLQEKIKAWNEKIIQELESKPLHEFKDYQPPRIDWSGFEDSHTYHKSIQNQITVGVKELFSRFKSISFRWAFREFLKYAHFSDATGHKNEYTNACLAEFRDELRKDISRALKTLSLQQNRDELTQKRILSLINLLEGLT